MVVEETPNPAPRFATVVRGYDRLQVDDYVECLHQWVDQADHRAQQCEAASARATEEAEQLRRRLSAADADALTATPESMKALGNRVGTIMQSSFHAAQELHDRAEDDARATRAAAEERAAGIIADTTARAEELSRAAEDLFVEAKETLAGARAAVAQQVEEARARGEAERGEMLELARGELRELSRHSAGQEKASREQLAVLEEHRRRVLEEVALLHERLGKVGDGLAAPAVPAPPQQAAGQPAPRPPAQQAPAGQPHRQPEKAAAAAAPPPDDDTLVLELPQAAAGPTGGRRRRRPADHEPGAVPGACAVRTAAWRRRPSRGSIPPVVAARSVVATGGAVLVVAERRPSCLSARWRSSMVSGHSVATNREGASTARRRRPPPARRRRPRRGIKPSGPRCTSCVATSNRAGGSYAGTRGATP